MSASALAFAVAVVAAGVTATALCVSPRVPLTRTWLNRTDYVIAIAALIAIWTAVVGAVAWLVGA